MLIAMLTQPICNYHAIARSIKFAQFARENLMR